ncbi:hypothetical protein NKJ35_24330 [Mesorhizobium sp. M0136]|uniref:hypothetical protein n=1 Tax=Mesorhizobium sp. M0136 TaxID=2956890 RepID=UPI00333DA180
MQTHVKRKVNGRTLIVTVAKAKAMDSARKLAVSGKGNAAYQKRILQLQSEVERLETRLSQYYQELTAALNRNVRAHETIRVLSGLLTEADAQVIARRQLDDDIPL